VKALSTSILGRRIGGGGLMVDSMHGTPIMHRFGNQLAIVAHEYFEAMISLIHNRPMPKLYGRTRFIFRSQRQAPNITGEVIDEIHRVQTARVRSTGHWTTQVNVNPFQRAQGPYSLPRFGHRRACLFAENTVVTSGRCGGKVYTHTFNNTFACHVDDGVGAAVAQAMVPGL